MEDTAHVETARIVQEIDAEIAKLTAARNILSGAHSYNRTASVASGNGGGQRTHRLTPEGRRRLSEMMKKRWAERRKRVAAKAK